jgi:hypothetical protein
VLRLLELMLEHHAQESAQKKVDSEFNSEPTTPEPFGQPIELTLSL